MRPKRYLLRVRGASWLCSCALGPAGEEAQGAMTSRLTGWSGALWEDRGLGCRSSFLGAGAAARVKSSWGSLPRLTLEHTVPASTPPTGSSQILTLSAPQKRATQSSGYGFQTIHGRRNQRGSATAWGHTASARVCSPANVTQTALCLAWERRSGGQTGPLWCLPVMPVLSPN